MNELALALRDLDEDRVYELVEEKIDSGVSPLEIIADCNSGMVAVGELFSNQKYFISQLMFSSEILKNVMARLEPIMKDVDRCETAGTVIIGTVKGDIHDIGKDIVISLLRGSGFTVVDLGVDVPAERFVEAVKETGARVLGMSALLNMTYPEMKTVVDALEAAGIRSGLTVIIGGAPVDERVRAFSGADYYAEDAVAGVNICKKIYSG